MKTLIGATLLAAFAMAAPAGAQHRDRDRYTVTVDNHYGEEVHFSCNGGAPRELHNGESRAIYVHAGSSEISCVASHGGQQVWHRSVHADPHNRHIRVTVTRPQEHHD